MQKDVVVLTASFGSGHHTAMQAITTGLLKINDQLIIANADIYEIATPELKTRLSKTYDFLTKTQLPLYNPLYSLRNGKHLRIDDVMVSLYFHRFNKLMREWKPKVIISVFPTGAEFAAKYKTSGDEEVLLCTVITDVVANWEWIHAQTDLYAVPTQSIRLALEDKGISKEKISVTGVPVCTDTDHLSGINEKNTASSFKASRPQVLVVGAIGGWLNSSDTFIDFMNNQEANFDVVAGKNLRFFEQMQSKNINSNVSLTGFAADLQQRMELADIIVTKPGGATLFESIAHEVPIVAYRSTVSQELSNARFIESNGIGVCYRSELQLIEKLETLLKSPSTLRTMKENIRKVKGEINLDELLYRLVEATLKERKIPEVTKRHKSAFSWMEKESIDEIRNIPKTFKTRRISNRK